MNESRLVLDEADTVLEWDEDRNLGCVVVLGLLDVGETNQGTEYTVLRHIEG
jgi:hypothetical protein